LREVPFDQLESGIYITGAEVQRDICPNLTFGCPDLSEVFGDFSDRIFYAATADGLPDYEQLPNGEGVMTVADWQDDLKKVTMRISWDDPNTAVPKSYEKHYFLHKDRVNE
jgi:hypothetical protein